MINTQHVHEIRQGDDNKFIPMTSVRSGRGTQVTDDIFYFTQQIVNVIFVGNPDSGDWVLIDAGMPHGGNGILKKARKRFGGRKPSAIILTHGHFDHVGGIKTLLEEWDCPVYAHALEFPFLTGEQAYPDPDTSVEGGLLAKISSIYPTEPIDISARLQQLPGDGTVPFLPGWSWIHVPGHAPGQVAFFREADRTLLSADAVITVRQDEFYKVLVQQQEVCGPPVYLTTDWQAAQDSVSKLATLLPQCLVPGHGKFITGERLKRGLNRLVKNFADLAVPSHGKWVD